VVGSCKHENEPSGSFDHWFLKDAAACVRQKGEKINKRNTICKQIKIKKATGGLVERMYSSYSFSTSALDGVNSQRHAPVALYPPGKYPRYPFYRRLGGPQSRSGHRD
jgi:hypothetical protein